MLKVTLSAARLQLHYQHPAPELNAQQLCFPSTEPLLDHKQVQSTVKYPSKNLQSVCDESECAFGFERGLWLVVVSFGDSTL